MIFGNKEQILYGNRFNGTKGNGYQPIKKVMTNEEWFYTLTTKGKAEVIAQLSSYGGNVEAILVWLKQPHKEEREK